MNMNSKCRRLPQMWTSIVCAATLAALSVGRSYADGQSATVTAPGSVTIEANASSASYSASVTTTDPTVNSEQKIDGATYVWSTGGTGASTTVTVGSSSSDYTSTVSCTVTWTVEDDSTSTPTYTYPSAPGAASVAVHICSWGPWHLSGSTIDPSVIWDCFGDISLPTCIPGGYALVRASSCDPSVIDTPRQCHETLTQIGPIEVGVGTDDDHWVAQFQESDDCAGSQDGQILQIEPNICCS
jgi:hypothetical protein